MAPSAAQAAPSATRDLADDVTGDTLVTVRYWAAARAAAGVEHDLQSGATVGAVVDAAVRAHPGLERIAAVATFLVEGRAASRETPVDPDATVEVLPPFAGG
jgi:molybdopterin converting factor small subunit